MHWSLLTLAELFTVYEFFDATIRTFLHAVHVCIILLSKYYINLHYINHIVKVDTVV